MPKIELEFDHDGETFVTKLLDGKGAEKGLSRFLVETPIIFGGITFDCSAVFPFKNYHRDY